MFLARRGRDYEEIYRQKRGSPILSSKKTFGAQRTGLLNLRREDTLLQRKCAQGFIVLMVAHAKR